MLPIINLDAQTALPEWIALRDKIKKCLERLGELEVASNAQQDGDLQPNHTVPDVPKKTSMYIKIVKPQPNHVSIEKKLTMKPKEIIPNQINAPKEANINEELTVTPHKTQPNYPVMPVVANIDEELTKKPDET